jgi:hypothetical protein
VCLTSPQLLHEVANPFFLNQANDVAVSIANMGNIAPGRKPHYDIRPVGCDHLSYFRNTAGWRHSSTNLYFIIIIYMNVKVRLP